MRPGVLIVEGDSGRDEFIKNHEARDSKQGRE